MMNNFLKLIKKYEEDEKIDEMETSTCLYIQTNDDILLTMHDEQTTAIYINVNTNEKYIKEVETNTFVMSIREYLEYVPSYIDIVKVFFVNSLTSIKPNHLTSLIDKIGDFSVKGCLLLFDDYFINESKDQVIIDYFKFISNPLKKIEESHYYSRKELRNKLKIIGFNKMKYISKKSHKYREFVSLIKTERINDKYVLLSSLNTPYNLNSLNVNSIVYFKEILKGLDLDTMRWLVRNNDKLSVDSLKTSVLNSKNDQEFINKIRNI